MAKKNTILDNKMKKTKKLDLHCHTTASDGIKTPRELVDFAIGNGIDILAITDHDTLGGIDEAVQYAKSKEIQLVPGIEFSIDYDDGSFHLVGLGIDYTDEAILKRTQSLQDARDSRIYHMVGDLKRHKINISVDEVLEESGGGVMGRPHVARVLIKHGYASDMKEVFANYLVKGKPGYVSKERISLEEATTLIKNAGGISIVAHPASIRYADMNEFERKLNVMMEKGVQGLEVFASLNEPEDIEGFLNLVEKYSLIISGGSDYHGDKEEIIGSYRPGHVVPYDIVHESVFSRI